MQRLVIVILALVAATPTWAGDFKLPPGKWWEDQRLVERIDLKPEQQEQIRSLVLEHARRMIDLNADVKRAELDLAEQVDRAELEVDGVRAAFATLQKARERLEREHFELLLAVRQSLSAEQWRALTDLRREVIRRRLEGERGRMPRLRGGARGDRPRPQPPNAF